ncbi:hypothetical protein AB0K93_34795 [Streptomyces sp. NPDC052676]|uniref:hypothetical protein n=1 Tax=Streptomyces sp. NPDC052676 TaxID=3154953 RepID=UPI00343FD06A
MVLSLTMWGWFGYRLLRDNHREFGGHAEDGHTLVGILALAVIPTIIAATTAVYSRVLFLMARQVLARSRGKGAERAGILDRAFPPLPRASAYFG